MAESRNTNAIPKNETKKLLTVGKVGKRRSGRLQPVKEDLRRTNDWLEKVKNRSTWKT